MNPQPTPSNIDWGNLLALLAHNPDNPDPDTMPPTIPALTETVDAYLHSPQPGHPDDWEDLVPDDLDEPVDDLDEPNLVLVAIGYPRSGDADRITADPGLLEQLTQLWVNNPPDADLRSLADTNPDLARLLQTAGQTSPTTTQSHSEEVTSPVRLGGDRRGSYRLAAATSRPVTVDFPGGRATTEKHEGGVTRVELRYDHDTIAHYPRTQLVGQLRHGDQTLFVILLRATESPNADLVGTLLIPQGVSVYDFEPDQPVTIAPLKEAPEQAIIQSVTWSGGDGKNAWRQIADRLDDDILAPRIRRGLSSRTQS